MDAKHKYALCDLDDLCFRMKCAIETVDAVHTAMESGPNTAESYLDALYGVYRSLATLSDEMREITDQLFEERRAERKKEGEAHA